MFDFCLISIKLLWKSNLSMLVVHTCQRGSVCQFGPDWKGWREICFQHFSQKQKCHSAGRMGLDQITAKFATAPWTCIELPLEPVGCQRFNIIKLVVKFDMEALQSLTCLLSCSAAVLFFRSLPHFHTLSVVILSSNHLLACLLWAN